MENSIQVRYKGIVIKCNEFEYNDKYHLLIDSNGFIICRMGKEEYFIDNVSKVRDITIINIID